MQFSTMYNNVAHRAGDTSSDGVTRAKEACNDAYQDIVTDRFSFSWLTGRENPLTASLSTSSNAYTIDSGISKVEVVWFEFEGFPIHIHIKDSIKEFNKHVINDVNDTSLPTVCFIDYKENKIVLNVYPSQAFIDQYTNIKYVGRLDLTELSGDSDVPILPARHHRKLQDLATEFRKYDKGDITFAQLMQVREIIIRKMVDEDNAYNENIIYLESGSVSSSYDYS